MPPKRKRGKPVQDNDQAVEFQDVDSASEFKLMPDGDYILVCDKVDDDEGQRTDENGNTQWGTRWVVYGVVVDGTPVVGGEHAGNFVWDTWNFGEKALPRTKLAGERCGIDMERSWKLGELKEELLGSISLVTVGSREYEAKDKETGAKKKRKTNSIPFAGYAVFPEDWWEKFEGYEAPKRERKEGSKREKAAAATTPDDDIPF